MLRFVIRKMLSKKWMVLSLLIGNILLVSIAAGNPMYTQAVFQRTLTKQLEASLAQTNIYPGQITLRTDAAIDSRGNLAQRHAQALAFPQAFGLEALHELTHLGTMSYKAELDVPRSDAKDISVSLNAMTGMEDHIRLVAGTMFSSQPYSGGTVDAIVSENMLKTTDLLLGDVITLLRLPDPQGNPLRVRIAGVFANSSMEDAYWVKSPASYSQHCFIHPRLFDELFLRGETFENGLKATWYTLLDYTAMRGDEAQRLLDLSAGFAQQFNSKTNRVYEDAFSVTLTRYLKDVKKVEATLWVLQVPVFILLAAFIFMVSRQMLQIEQNEIAVIKSRGAGRGQIFAVYLVQSVLISLLSLAAGLPLGAYLCQVLGASNAFLEFVRRSALPVELSAKALCFAGLASLLSIGAMVLPAWRFSKTGIVDHKRRRSRRSQTPLWQKLGLDGILLGTALYGLYSFNSQKELLAARVQEGASLDPLLFLSSSLFMIGAGLLAVRLTPVIAWAVFRLFRRWWSPALYASFLHVLRTRSSQSFMMVFLIMTIALGVFNAQAARTINQNAQDNLYYSIGADVVLAEKWDSTEHRTDEAGAVGAAPVADPEYHEPDFGRYEALEGAESLARVYVNKNATASVTGGSVKKVTLMGIHTKDFGQTAWFKDSLSDIHWYHYLNAMSRNSRAILVSRTFQTDYGCKLGDSITYSAGGSSMRGVIYGFVDYFPGFAPVTYARGTDGLYRETKNHLIVAHLPQVQSAMGVLPYQIWIRNKGSSAYLYDFAEQSGVSFTLFEDAAAQLIEKKNDPILQGTNGILTVGFIVVLVLCSVGFLIYWVLSIQSRSLLFGIFRAMGMTMREVFTMLINEQLFISGISIAVGALVGQLTSSLYMPLIQLGYAASDNALPLEVVSLPADNIRLFVVVGAVMLICMIVLGVLISHMKIAQALKLGED